MGAFGFFWGTRPIFPSGLGTEGFCNVLVGGVVVLPLQTQSAIFCRSFTIWSQQSPPNTPFPLLSGTVAFGGTGILGWSSERDWGLPNSSVVPPNGSPFGKNGTGGGWSSERDCGLPNSSVVPPNGSPFGRNGIGGGWSSERDCGLPNSSVVPPNGSPSGKNGTGGLGLGGRSDSCSRFVFSYSAIDLLIFRRFSLAVRSFPSNFDGSSEAAASSSNRFIRSSSLSLWFSLLPCSDKPSLSLASSSCCLARACFLAASEESGSSIIAWFLLRCSSRLLSAASFSGLFGFSLSRFFLSSLFLFCSSFFSLIVFSLASASDTLGSLVVADPPPINGKSLSPEGLTRWFPSAKLAIKSSKSTFLFAVSR